MDPSNPMWDDPEVNKLWEAKFRCANLRTCFSKKNSNPMASIDSSAPETTSSDNSPTVIRRAWKMQGPGSDSGWNYTLKRSCSFFFNKEEL
jgi:hypothetical protein